MFSDFFYESSLPFIRGGIQGGVLDRKRSVLKPGPRFDVKETSPCIINHVMLDYSLLWQTKKKSKKRLN